MQLVFETGNVLLSRAVSHQVSSALKSLTSVFEMGTGVSSPLLPPDSLYLIESKIPNNCIFQTEVFENLLVKLSTY